MVSERDSAQAAAWQPAPPSKEVEHKPDPYDGNRYPTPLRSGQWEAMALGPVVPYAEDQDIARRYYGLPHRETYFNLKFWTADGTIYMINDKFDSPVDDGQVTAVPWYPTAVIDPTDGKRTPDPRRAALTGNATYELTPDGRNRYVAETVDGSDEFLYDEKTFVLTSTNGALDVRGVMPTPACQILLPWRSPGCDTDMMYYVCQWYYTEGSYLGEQTTGYCMVDTVWGNDRWGDNWWFQNRPPQYSLHALTTYADGITEMCRIFYGEYGARGALIVDSNRQVIVNSGEVNVEKQAGGRFVFSYANGPQWEFVPDHPDTHFPAVVRRIGETREVVRAYAYCSVKTDGLRPPTPLGQTRRPMG
jgi:hypothetical protein